MTVITHCFTKEEMRQTENTSTFYLFDPLITEITDYYNLMSFKKYAYGSVVNTSVRNGDAKITTRNGSKVRPNTNTVTDA